MTYEEFLIDNGYRKFTNNKEYTASLFQKKVKTPTGSYYINIDHYEPHIPHITEHQFEISMCYETSLDRLWFNCSYYTLNEKKLKKLLTTLEVNLTEVFYKLGGKKDVD